MTTFVPPMTVLYYAASLKEQLPPLVTEVGEYVTDLMIVVALLLLLLWRRLWPQLLLPLMTMTMTMVGDYDE
jgi:hypothetical protein